MESIFRRHVGPAFDLLPEMVRRSHELPVRASGHADVRWGPGPAARLLARVLRMPPEGAGKPLTMEMREEGGRVLIDRAFDGRHFRSVQALAGGVVRERVGPAVFDFVLEADAERLVYRLVGVRVLGVPAPSVSVTTEVEPHGDGWRAHVTVEARPLGRILDYEARVEPR